MLWSSRFKPIAKAAAIHLTLSVFLAGLVATLVLGVWYPFPYRNFSGGIALFLLVIAVDVISGPILTLVIYNPTKHRNEQWRDLALVGVVQLAALVYGMQIVWQARPLFLVHEIDRFKVVVAPDLEKDALKTLPISLQPGFWSGPVVVAVRAPKDNNEREKILFESVQGGRDYGERPEFYIAYEGPSAQKALSRAKPLPEFLLRQPEQLKTALKLADAKKTDISQWLYLPIVARQDWVAVLNKKGAIEGFLQGDGF